jgi:hypothetical protein
VAIGPKEYRDRLRATRTPDTQNANSKIPKHIKIAGENKPIRVLGAFGGNDIDNTGVWKPVLDAINKRLEVWMISRITVEGRRHVVNMIIQGKSQYRAVVQEILTPITKLLQKRINKYMWNGRPPAVNKQTMSEPLEKGGKNVLDIETLKEAIDLMRLKRYLTLEDDKRPVWHT